MAKVPGSLWVEGTFLHFIDQYSREWRYPGNYNGSPSGARPGSIWTYQGYLFFIGQDGLKYYVNAFGDQISPKSSRPGSLWVETQDNQLHYITEVAWSGDPANYW